MAENNAARPVGSESSYSKEPFTDTVRRSVPPSVPGATGQREAGTNNAHGGKGKSSTFSEAKKQFERDRSPSAGRSPWCD